MKRTAFAALTLTVLAILVAGPASALPNYTFTTCIAGGCHVSDASVTVTPTFVDCTGTNANYTIDVSGPYSGLAGWGVYQGASPVDSAFLNNATTFSVPADGPTTYDVYGAINDPGNGRGNMLPITPDCSVAQCTDGDLDGYYAEPGCGTAVDCDDSVFAINPGAEESCTDGIDNNCNGLVDVYDPGAVGCAPPPSSSGAATDFNGDGKSDIVWRNSTTGDIYLWLMDGSLLASAQMIGNVADQTWVIVELADFNGDGKCDLLWRNSATGDIVLWTMNGSEVASIEIVSSVSDLNWRIIDVTDFNGDGNADILWHHLTGGSVYIWFMNGAAIVSGEGAGAVPDPNWQMIDE